MHDSWERASEGRLAVGYVKRFKWLGFIPTPLYNWTLIHSQTGVTLESGEAWNRQSAFSIVTCRALGWVYR